MKQRFGEVLALVLIVMIVGSIVYMLIPSNPKAPKLQPVTVRSTAKIVAQSHVALVDPVADQTPPATLSLQATTASNLNPSSQHIGPTATKNLKNKISIHVNQSSQLDGSAPATLSGAITKSACTPLPKSVTNVGLAALQSIPIVGSLIPEVSNCTS